MKRALKLSLAALAATAIAVPAHANMVSNIAVKAGATYTEASGNGLDFATVTTAPNTNNVFVKPDHDFDFNLGLSYRLSGHDTRLFVDYDHFRDTESKDVSGGAGVTSNVGGGAAVAAGVTITGTAYHKERDFKLGAVHTLHFGPKFDLDLSGALEYSKIERRLTTRLSTGVSNVHFNESKGWGPFMSATGRVYPWGDHNRCWNLFAKAGLGLIYADHNDYQHDSNAAGVVTASTSYDETNSLLTRVETEVGVEWNRVMRADYSDLALGIKLGVRYHNMNNAFKNGNAMAAPESVDFGRMGPFLEFKLGGANA